MGKVERKYLAHYIDSSFGEHYEYAKTSDVSLDSSKTYYTKSGDVYSAVAEPNVSNIASYYERFFAPQYYRLGKDLEEYNEELNPDVEVQKNIWGEQNVMHNGYEVQSEVEPFYAYDGDPLFSRLCDIANGRLTGDACMTTKVDVLVDSEGEVIWAYREDCYVVPTQVGGDTSGVQIPFTVYNAGNRISGDFDTATKEFTED